MYKLFIQQYSQTYPSPWQNIWQKCSRCLTLLLSGMIKSFTLSLMNIHTRRNPLRIVKTFMLVHRAAKLLVRSTSIGLHVSISKPSRLWSGSSYKSGLIWICPVCKSAKGASLKKRVNVCRLFFPLFLNQLFRDKKIKNAIKLFGSKSSPHRSTYAPTHSFWALDSNPSVVWVTSCFHYVCNIITCWMNFRENIFMNSEYNMNMGKYFRPNVQISGRIFASKFFMVKNVYYTRNTYIWVKILSHIIVG